MGPGSSPRGLDPGPRSGDHLGASPARRRWVAPLLALAALKLCVSAVVLAQGVTAISDDDFARVVIAQDFAARPRLDPSGTSWLPLPFWVYGAPMLLLGDSWQVARGVAVGLGVVSVWLVWGAARLFGASPWAAALGAALSALFPYSAWLGVATVPELPTAALTLFALGCSARAAELLGPTTSSPPSRLPWLYALLGALAITAACASRYEAWPVAVGLALVTLRDARRATTRGRDSAVAPPGATWLERGARPWLVATFVAVCFPLAWLLHGLALHDDPLFFLRRVVEYKRALGGSASGLVELLSTYPVAFVRGEPELVLGGAALLGLTRTSLRWRRAAWLLGGALLALVAGDLRGGGPTHHPERALVTGWLLVAVLTGDALTRLRLSRAPLAAGADRLRRPLAAGVALAMVALVIFGARWLRCPDLTTASFQQRADELAAGELLRTLASPEDPVAVATDDYGFFAVLAALGRPGRAHVLEDHDPRRSRGHPPSPEERQQHLQQLGMATGSRWLVFPRAWSAGPALGRLQAERGALEVRLFAPGEAGENSPARVRLH